MENKKETIKDKIKKIEGKYVCAVWNMDKANDKASEARERAKYAESKTDYNEADYQRREAEEHEREARAHALESCTLGEVLAILENKTFDEVCQELHNRFNLWRK